MKTNLILALVILTLCGCNKKKYFDGPDFYKDDFEMYMTIEDMFLPYPDLDKYWSFRQNTLSENYIVLDSTFSHSGGKSIKFFGQKSNSNVVSKASINKQHMAFWENETMRITAWFYIKDTNKLDWLFLIDLEENTAIGAGPGLRLALVNNNLVVEHKFKEKDIFQTAGSEADFPRNQWVEIVWEIKLSKKKKGTVKVWQNGTMILNATNTKTLPKDFLYFQQGTKGIYSNVEFGATAGSFDNDVTLWLDDIKVEKIN